MCGRNDRNPSFFSFKSIARYSLLLKLEGKEATMTKKRTPMNKIKEVLRLKYVVV